MAIEKSVPEREGAEFQVYRDFFPHRLFSCLQLCGWYMDSRKVEFRPLSEEAEPKEVIKGRDFLRDSIGFTANVAVLKRYRISDTYRSRAYEPHEDPQEFAGGKFVMATLFGEAKLYIGEEGAEEEIHCRPNTVVVADPHARHWVTPPLNTEGFRDFLFYGYDQALSGGQVDI